MLSLLNLDFSKERLDGNLSTKHLSNIKFDTMQLQLVKQINESLQRLSGS